MKEAAAAVEAVEATEAKIAIAAAAGDAAAAEAVVEAEAAGGAMWVTGKMEVRDETASRAVMAAASDPCIPGKGGVEPNKSTTLGKSGSLGETGGTGADKEAERMGRKKASRGVEVI